MVNKPQDFLTLTGAARRARSEGYDITYHSLRNLVAARLHKSRTERITYLHLLPKFGRISSRMVSQLNRAWSTSLPRP